MDSNSLFKLQSDYGSESDSEEMETKADLIVGSDPKLITSVADTNSDQIQTIVAIDPILDIEPKAKLSTDNDIKPDTGANSKSDPNTKFSPNVNLHDIGMNSSYQQIKDSSNEIDISSDSSSSSWSLSSDESHEEISERNLPKTFPKTKGEFSLEDLPPIENLTISVGVEELSQLGRVVSLVDQLVIIQSFRLMPALDLDSVLFFKDGQPLGQIFDVFGPVVEPRYAIRFNDVQQIIDLKISVDTPVYFAAEQKQPITGFVFAEQLRRMKGSDASWKHNNEPPEEMVEYSDDESERLHKKKLNSKRSFSQRNKLKQNSNINPFVWKQT